MSWRIERWMWWSLGLWMGCVIALLMHGCYADHVAEPCDASLAAGEKGSVVASSTPGSPKDPQDAATRPVEAVRDDQQEICAGPIVAGECYRDIHDVVSR